MEQHPDTRPVTWGDLRNLEQRVEIRVGGVETRQGELRADFRSFTSARYGAAAMIAAALAGAAVTYLLTVVLS